MSGNPFDRRPDFGVRRRLRPSPRAGLWVFLAFLAVFAVGWGLDAAGLLPVSPRGDSPASPALGGRFLLH